MFLTSPSPLLLAPRSLRDSYAVMVLGLSFLFLATPGRAQVGNSGSIEGVVKDQSGSAVGNASVEVMNPVSGFHRETTTDSDGAFRFTNVPFNPYHMVAGAPGFAKYTQDVDVRSTVPISTQITLKIAAAAAHHISVRYLHFIFNERGLTVGGWIRMRRLDQCRAALIDRRHDKSITEIALNWGFSDAAHFSRSFKASFGTTPTEYRRRVFPVWHSPS